MPNPLPRNELRRGRTEPYGHTPRFSPMRNDVTPCLVWGYGSRRAKGSVLRRPAKFLLTTARTGFSSAGFRRFAAMRVSGIAMRFAACRMESDGPISGPATPTPECTMSHVSKRHLFHLASPVCEHPTASPWQWADYIRILHSGYLDTVTAPPPCEPATPVSDDVRFAVRDANPLRPVRKPAEHPASTRTELLCCGPQTVVVGYGDDLRVTATYVRRPTYGSRKPVAAATRTERPLPAPVDGDDSLTLANGRLLGYATGLAARLTKRDGCVDRHDIAQDAVAKLLEQGFKPDQPIEPGIVYRRVYDCVAEAYRRRGIVETRTVTEDRMGNAVIIGADSPEKITLRAEMLAGDILPDTRLVAECLADIAAGVDPATGETLHGERSRLLTRAAMRVSAAE